MSTPPLLIASSLTRGGPSLRRVNPEAISHVTDLGTRFEEVYPDGVAQLRSIAPNLMTGAEINPAAKAFVEATGLPFGEIYPEHGGIIALPPAPKRSNVNWRAVATVAGLVGGAFLIGPVGAIIGGAVGWAAGGAT